MKIGIIGVGSFTLGLASRSAEAGYDVIINNPRGNHLVRETVEMMNPNMKLGSLEEVASAEIILFFIPKDDLLNVIQNLPDMTGKIIVHTSNLIFNPQSLLSGISTSQSYKNTALLLPEAHVVKLFNPIQLDNCTSYSQHRNIEKIYFISDDDQSKYHINIFLKNLHFSPIDLSDQSKLQNVGIDQKSDISPLLIKYDRIGLHL